MLREQKIPGYEPQSAFSREMKLLPVPQAHARPQWSQSCRGHMGHLSVPTRGSSSLPNQFIAALGTEPPCLSRTRVPENLRAARSYFQGTLINCAVISEGKHTSLRRYSLVSCPKRRHTCFFGRTKLPPSLSLALSLASSLSFPAMGTVS